MTAEKTFTLIDEQDDFIVVDKNQNCNFHDEGEHNEGLFNQVKVQLNLSELYPVHRLDKMTSGLVIFAKNLSAAQQFQVLFSEHLITKFYLAISDIKPKKKQGLIKGDMEKSRRGMWKLLRSANNPAITQFFSYSIGNAKRLYLLKPHSGKTHQIRVALNSIGAPIIGDEYYYPVEKSKVVADRGYLHAYALEFSLNDKCYRYLQAPTTGEAFVSQAVTEQLKQLTQPSALPWPSL